MLSVLGKVKFHLDLDSRSLPNLALSIDELFKLTEIQNCFWIILFIVTCILGMSDERF